jgi:predicted  nucleic acid-binding Zn-ribbon protein
MAPEQEYRELLHKAQESAQCIKHFLDALKGASRSHTDAKLLELISIAEKRARTLEHELDQVWDLFKRPF